MASYQSKDDNGGEWIRYLVAMVLDYPSLAGTCFRWEDSSRYIHTIHLEEMTLGASNVWTTHCWLGDQCPAAYR